MWQAIWSIFTSLSRVLRKSDAGSVKLCKVSERIASPTRVTIMSMLLDDQDQLLIANVGDKNKWDVFFAKTLDEGRQALEKLQPHIILLDRDLADGNWRSALSACASTSAACTMLISRVADDYLWNEVVCNGGYDVLAKPLREQDVLRAVRFAWSYLNSTRQTAAIPRK